MSFSDSVFDPLDPVERACEILFGVIMVLTFTGSISVAEGGAAETRTILAAAIGCNLAWGLVDAAMYLLATFTNRARGLATIRAIQQNRGDRARRLIREALPPVVSAMLTPTEVDAMCERLIEMPEPSALVSLRRGDFAAAGGVFLLVFLSTFPIVIPFIFIREVGFALRTSNAVALVMLFATGWSLGRYTGRSTWRFAIAFVTVGIVLVGITIALGG